MVRLKQDNGGFALLTALWLIVMAVSVTAATLVPARTQRLLLANQIADVQARHAAYSGALHALALLETLVSGDLSAHSGKSSIDHKRLGALSSELDEVRLGPVAFYSVKLRDAHSRLPLNSVTERELRRLLAAVGVSHPTTLVVAASVVDWRDPDDLHRAHGAEWPDHYSTQVPPRVPRNAPFESLEELRFVRGVDEVVYGRIRPFLSLSSDARVNLNAAPEVVLNALPGMSAEATAIVMARRRAGSPIAGLDELQLLLSAPARAQLQDELGALRQRAVFQNSAVEIESVGWVEGSPIRRRVVATAVVTSGGIQVVGGRQS